MSTKQITDNAALMLSIQERCNDRGSKLVLDGWGGDATRRELDKHFPRLTKPKPAATPAAVQIVVPARTKRTVENMGSLNKKARPKLEAFLVDAEQAMAVHGVRVEVISGLRSWGQQAELYAQGRTKPGRIVTKARPGSSWHNYGLAIDLGLFRGGVYLDEADPKLTAKLYAELGKLAAAMGIEWAGTWKSFPEGPHFQWNGGLTLADARKRMKAVNYDVQLLFT